jgi:3-deoxy-manno-octulosonate cytidylyltransferase (CMP-KDO synthetase)
MSFNIVIPARYGSTRLPGKALLHIAGKPMVAWVWERAMDAGASHVIVATDDERIADEMLSRGAEVVMTRADHVSGTDRLAEVAECLAWHDEAIVVNLQGDEPLMPVANIRRVAAMLEENSQASIATLMEPLERAEADEPSIVKVVASESGRALYFSRSCIPAQRGDSAPAPVFRHVGLYGYRAGFLRQFVGWAPAPAELSESLEQLRALANDVWIQVEAAPEPVPAGVDTQADLEAMRERMASEQ